MLNLPLLRPFLWTLGLLSPLALTACAAISDESIVYRGSPCNTLCQRWMGIEARPQTASAPTTAATPDPRPIVPRTPSGRVRRERVPYHRPAASAAARTRVVAPATSSGLPQPAIAASIPSDGWGRPLPGSSQALPGIWLPQ